MNKTQDAWELINLDDENGIEREINQEIEPKIEVKKSRKKDSIDWQMLAGKWEFLFKCAVGVWVISLLIFAYVADSLDTEINQL
jgi:hypothetical protein